MKGIVKEESEKEKGLVKRKKKRKVTSHCREAILV